MSKVQLPASRYRNAKRIIRAFANDEITGSQAILRLDAIQFKVKYNALCHSLLSEEASGDVVVFDAARGKPYIISAGSY